MKVLRLIIPVLLAAIVTSTPQCAARKFIAHRGVNLRSTIAGENSLEAIRLAARAGFEAIETDVRLTADDSLIVMHDATLNRTCVNVDGTPVSEPVAIADLTYAELADYRLKADSADMRSEIPLLSTYLEHCRDNGIFTFIEPKLVDSTGVFYERIISLADNILGKNNYVITSNNKANDIIRDTLKKQDVPLMGILYQSTYPDIERLGNIIMAISATRIKEPEYTDFVNLSVSKGIRTESHADRFEYLDRVNRNRIDYVSTDFLAPDIKDSYRIAARFEAPVSVNGAADLPAGEILEIPLDVNIYFGAAYLDMAFEGKMEISLGNQKFIADSNDNLRFQLILYDTKPVLVLKAMENSRVSKLELTAVEF